MSYEQLSREELINQLNTVKPDYGQCEYIPRRGNMVRCTTRASKPWGFCDKHKKTVAGKRAREGYEQRLEEERQLRESVGNVVGGIIEGTTDAMDNTDTTMDNTNNPNNTNNTNTEDVNVDENREETTAETTLEDANQSALLGEEELEEREEVGLKPKMQKTILRNRFGNFEDPETGIVFDVHTRKAYRVQLPDGSLGPLTERDINICEQNLWDYDLPSYESSDDGDEEFFNEHSGESSAESVDSVKSAEEELDREIEEIDEDEEYYTDEEVTPPRRPVSRRPAPPPRSASRRQVSRRGRGNIRTTQRENRPNSKRPTSGRSDNTSARRTKSRRDPYPRTSKNSHASQRRKFKEEDYL